MAVNVLSRIETYRRYEKLCVKIYLILTLVKYLDLLYELLINSRKCIT